jgi:predicted TIM-barrel fold metal-dependent hydrolase
MDGNDLPIIDCHQHFYDAGRMRYPVFEGRSAGFEALLGDYSASRECIFHKITRVTALG